MPNRTIPHDTGDMIPNGGAHMIPAGVQDEVIHDTMDSLCTVCIGNGI